MQRYLDLGIGVDDQQPPRRQGDHSERAQHDDKYQATIRARAPWVCTCGKRDTGRSTSTGEVSNNHRTPPLNDQPDLAAWPAHSPPVGLLGNAYSYRRLGLVTGYGSEQEWP